MGDQYGQIVDKLTNGKAVRWDEYIAHLDVQNAGAPAGLDTGSAFPDFALRDQHGVARTLQNLRGPKGLLLVFVRSAHWCGYCRNQLTELNRSRAALEQSGVAVAALAPDAADVVREFAAFAGLEYPLLNDVRAEFAERLGLLNPAITNAIQNNGRVPFPGHVLLSPEGHILARQFTDDLRHRLSGASLAFERLGPGEAEPVAEAASDVVSLRAWMASSHLHTGQEVSLRLEIAIAEGWRIYAAGSPPHYRPLTLTFDDALLGHQQFDFPEGEDFLSAASGEEARVHRASVTASGRLRLKWSPPVHGSQRLVGIADRLAGMQTQPGRYQLTGKLLYQACADDVCLPPAELAFSIPIEILPDSDKARAFFADDPPTAAPSSSQLK